MYISIIYSIVLCFTFLRGEITPAYKLRQTKFLSLAAHRVASDTNQP